MAPVSAFRSRFGSCVREIAPPAPSRQMNAVLGHHGPILAAICLTQPVDPSSFRRFFPQNLKLMFARMGQRDTFESKWAIFPRFPLKWRSFPFIHNRKRRAVHQGDRNDPKQQSQRQVHQASISKEDINRRAARPTSPQGGARGWSPRNGTDGGPGGGSSRVRRFLFDAQKWARWRRVAA